jgi:hypothetical protein
MPACSRCGKTLPKTDFTPKQLKAKASVRSCIACTQRSGTLDACFKQATSTAAAERPSQVVHERTIASTPLGKHVVVSMERVSTGGTRHEAQYKRPQSGQMNGSERMAKARARTSLFPDEAAAAREQNAGRMAAVRTAERTLFAETQQSQQILAGLADEAADVPAPTPAPAPLPHGLHLGPCLDADEPPLGPVLMFDSQEEERRYVTPSCSMFSVGMRMSRQCVHSLSQTETQTMP